MNCPDYRPFHGFGYRQAPSSCRSTAKSPQRRSPAPAAAMASAASGGGGRGSDERGGQRNGRPRRRTIRGVGRGSSCDPGERSGGRARQQLRSAASDAAAAAIPTSVAAVGRGRRAWRPAATPDRGTPPPPRATARCRPRRLRRQRPRRLRCQRPPPWRETSPEQPVPPQPMEPVAGTSSGYSPLFHDVNGSFANLRQTTTHRRPSPQLFRPKSPMRPCRPAITGSKGYSDPASDAKYGAFSRCSRANRHFVPRRQPPAVRS